VPHLSNWFNNLFIQAQYQYVAKQTRYDQGSDFASPPPAYGLINMLGGISCKLNKQELNLNMGVNNLLNKEYKEYMNRFRYYAHDMGRNVTVRLNYNF